MKPFVIDRNSWHYKMNLAMTDRSIRGWEAEHNNFCAYWRTTLVKIAAISAAMALVCLILYGIGTAAWANPMKALEVILIIIAVFCVIIGLSACVYYFMEYRNKKKNTPIEERSIFVQKLYTSKQKICPMVEFKE